MRLKLIMLVNEPYLIMMFINKIKLENFLLRRKNSSEFIRTGIGCDDDLPPPTAPAKKCSSTQGKKRSDNKNYWYIAGLTVVAVVAIVSPLDGPLGDVAAIGALSGALSQ